MVSKLYRMGGSTASAAPGTLVHVGEQRTEIPRITVFDYDAGRAEERTAERVEDCLGFGETPTVTWVNIDGIHDLDILERVGRSYGLHPLVLEDIANTTQRPKAEQTDGYLFLVVKMLTYDTARRRLASEQVSLVLGAHFVLSFQERPGDVFEPVRARIRKDKGRMRRGGPDYLAYALIDAIVDNYFIVLENVGEEVETIEDQVVARPVPGTLHRIHDLKREMIFLRKCVWPLRETIGSLYRDGSPLIAEGTLPYLRDLYDHTIQVMETVEAMRDMVSGMIDIYLSSLSNRMNEVMKVLTIIATIFIPLTFIAGIYGMNFRFMPELQWKAGYPAVWLVMAAVAGIMLAFFRRKHWL